MAKDIPENVAPATRLVTAGRRADWTGTPAEPGAVVNPPVWRASTHLYPDSKSLHAGKPNEDGHFYYGRRGSPTQWALSDALTALEPGAAGTVLYPSGVAALAGALLSVLRPGDVLLMTDNAYEPTRSMGRGLLADFGIETRWFDPLDPDSFAAAIDERCKAVLLESPGSLTLEVCDVPALAVMAHARGIAVVLDNTWAGPLGFPALERGADITVMSLTKHVGGHSDLMLGSAATGEQYYAKLRRTAQALGQVVSPDDASLALRGLRTMNLRLQQETSSVVELSKWLESRPEVAKILCPMLPGSPGHDIWKRDFSGSGSLFAFELEPGPREAVAAMVHHDLGLTSLAELPPLAELDPSHLLETPDAPTKAAEAPLALASPILGAAAAAPADVAGAAEDRGGDAAAQAQVLH